MQRGRFAQEFLAELMREPRAIRAALLGERSRWLRSLKINGREEILFELELHLRSIELAFNRRHLSADGRALLGQDFAEEVRAIRDALHRATALCRRLTLTQTEQSFQFRSYIERQAAEDSRRVKGGNELLEQRTPEEALFVLRRHLRALQGLADQLTRQGYVTYQAFDDFSILGEQVILSNKYFRPPGALEFRAEYDRVGSVRLLDLVKRVSEARARKGLALGFLAAFRLLRYLRFIPAAPSIAPRRALLTTQLVHDESLTVSNYLTVDLPRLTTGAQESALIVAAAGDAAEYLQNAASQVAATLALRPVERSALDVAREALSEGAKAAASALARAVEPATSAAEIFDGQRARRERAERLRRDVWMAGQLLRQCLDALFPAMKGEQTRAFEAVEALSRFVREFRQVGYYLLRSGDHEPFDRFFQALEALTATAASPARDRHLYLECRRFLTVVERGYALVCRRAELLSSPLDTDSLQAELERIRNPASHEAAAVVPPEPSTAELAATAHDAMIELMGDPLDEFAPEDPDFVTTQPGVESQPGLEFPVDEGFEPDSTRRIWRRGERGQ